MPFGLWVPLVKPPFVAQPNHFVDEFLFLLAVEACIKRLGRVGDVALVLGAVDQELCFVAHLFDDVVGRIALGALNPQVETVSTIMSEIVHRAGEA